MYLTKFACNAVKFATRGNARIIKLNRPKALNSLTHQMIKDIRLELNELKDKHADLNMILLCGEGGKAFCAGGDIKNLTLPTYDGDFSGTDFFREEYQLDYAIATYPAPIVALMHGIVMGGGVGVSIHAPIRIGTEKTFFCMPETSIGLFPDVGTGYVLPRLNHKGLGMFLGLTGERLKGGDCKHAGIVTHIIHSSNIEDFESELVQLPAGCSLEEISSKVKEFEIDSGAFSLEPSLSNISKYFSQKKSIFDLVDSLQSSDDPWAQNIVTRMKHHSPTSLAITFEQMTKGATLELDEVFKMEYRMAYSCMRHEFAEGVRALLIDRDNLPKWQPSDIKDVSDEWIAHFFAEKPNEWHPTE